MTQPASDSIYVGAGARPVELLLRYANRHGLIAGATGTGKTVTLQLLAEGFSARGVPVFMADVKGDLAGLAEPGEPKPKIVERLQALKQPADDFRGFPALFWDLFGQQGHPVRTTIADVGPLLLARLLQLNEIQTGVLNLVFKVADDEQLLLLDLKDLRAMLAHVADNAATLTRDYGNVSAASIGAIQRALLVLEQQGAERFFGEPALQIADMMRQDLTGAGGISILAADRLMQSPGLYATFLTWLLAELFEHLPEVGDLDRPKLVLFFDEAHLLFDDAPDALVDKIEQVVRLIRSKGVGVYFVTQNPLDIPEKVLGQLGNRVQHALRAFTPRDQKAVRAAAQTMRANPAFDSTDAIMELGVGEALASVLDAKGTPTPVERILVRPPRSRLGPLTAEERRSLVDASPLKGVYDTPVDRESAYEHLRGRVESPAPEPEASPAPAPGPWGPAPGQPRPPQRGVWGPAPANPAPLPPSSPEPAPRGRMPRVEPVPERPAPRGGREPPSMTEKVVTSLARGVANSIGSSVGRAIVRGVLGSLLKGR